MQSCSTEKKMNPPPPEMFTAKELKEAREEFKNLKTLLDHCQKLSQDIETGKCDFNAILACLYAIEKNSMYTFLSERDSTLKQIIDVTFLRLRNVGGIIMVANKHEKMTKEEETEVEKMENDMQGLNELIEEKGITEADLKRSLEKMLEGDETPVETLVDVNDDVKK